MHSDREERHVPYCFAMRMLVYVERGVHYTPGDLKLIAAESADYSRMHNTYKVFNFKHLEVV